MKRTLNEKKYFLGNMTQVAVFFAQFFLIAMLSSCSNISDISDQWKKGSNPISVVSWNLQTFFDADEAGNEYSEFRGAKSKWNRNLYESRLEKLAEVMKKLDADIFCFIEIENASVMQDIANCFPAGFGGKSQWPYIAFARWEGSSIGIGIMSKIPIDDLKVHQIDCRAALPQKQFASCQPGQNMECPALRPTVELAFQNGLTMFACHWKSKSGGQENTEIWRDIQEMVLADLVKDAADKGKAVLVCGDLNRDTEEFAIDSQTGIVGLRGAGDTTEVFSPWPSSSSKGSYFYQEKWSSIDHFFSAGKAQIAEFTAETSGNFADEAGVPIKFTMWNGKGYSDHLPIRCKVMYIENDIKNSAGHSEQGRKSED